MLNDDTVRGRYIDGAYFQTRAKGEELDTAGEDFDQWLDAVRAEAWERAKRAISNIPCWYKDKENHGFDLGDDEQGRAVEAGARVLVMEVLDHNPYRDGEELPERRPRSNVRRRTAASQQPEA